MSPLNRPDCLGQTMVYLLHWDCYGSRTEQRKQTIYLSQALLHQVILREDLILTHIDQVCIKDSTEQELRKCW